ncbi:MAG: pseudouridine synthase [Alphaproteobacteria bacterium]|jgi:23S rRNA pseudouridine2605 synthase|tara:strand:+ start:24406 stop:25149 length:744 start_codon:yes stop_codon:yes gene_type:complete
MLNEKQRIAKIIARSGICSRRDAEKLILDKRVKLNHQTINTPAIQVTDSDVIEVDNIKIPTIQKTKAWLCHKPGGYITTSNDPQNRRTIFELLPKDFPRVITIGRLDINTEGLIILTNDGELARLLELPKTGLLRVYKVRVYKRITDNDLKKIRSSPTVDGVRYNVESADIISQTNSNTWLEIAIKEGKNREIRNILSFFDIRINRLIRQSYGPFQLGNIHKGEIIEIPAHILKKQISFIKKHSTAV